MGEAAGDASEFRPDGLYGQLEKVDRRRGEQERDNWPRNPRRSAAADDQHQQREDSQGGGLERESVEVSGERFHAQVEDAGHLFEVQSEEILDLRTRDQNSNTIGEPDHYRTRDELHGGAETSDAHDDQQHASHHRAHEQTIDAVSGDDSSYDYDEGTSGAADLSFRSTQRGNQKSSDDRAVNAGLRGEAGSDCERHRQGQCHEAYGDAGDQIKQKFVTVVGSETEDGLRKPMFA